MGWRGCGDGVGLVKRWGGECAATATRGGMWRQGGDGVGQCGDGMSHGISVTAASCGDGDGLGGTVALVAYV